MASVFKPVYLRPIPKEATRCKLHGEPAVRFTDERGKVHVRPVHRNKGGALTDKMEVKQGRWWMKYTLPDGTVRREKGFSDRAATEQEAGRRERLAQQQAAGMVVVDEGGLSAPLSAHLAEYIGTLKRKGRVANYYVQAGTRMERIFSGCGWQTLRDLAAPALEAYLNDLGETGGNAGESGLGPKTVNDYLAQAKAFVRWCIRTRRLAGNPLEGVDRISYERENDKAALTPEQAGCLLAVARHHRLLYLTALRTGLRRSELRALQWGDVHLDGPRPRVKLRASATKARRADTLPLRADVVDALRSAKPPFAASVERVFRSLPRMHTFRAALERAGIPDRDAAGKRVCFHSLRVTFGTWLAQAGTVPRTHMELMRHTDMKLTMTYYTDPRLLDTAGAVADLPDLGTALPVDVTGALRTGTDDMLAVTDAAGVLPRSTSATVRNGPELSTLGNTDIQKPLENKGFLMEAPGMAQKIFITPVSFGLFVFLFRWKNRTSRHGTWHF
jgi:integrase